MLANPPTEEHVKKNQKTTLIVVMSSLVSIFHRRTFSILLTRGERHQWFDEIKKHTPYEDVMIFNSSQEDINASRMTKEAIVLTTYHEMMKSIPYPDKTTIDEFKRKKLDVDKAIEDWIKEHMHEAGLLHQVNWYRVS